MFQKFVPKEVLENIIHGGNSARTVVDEIKTVTLLNIDIRGFTELAMEMGPQKTVSLLNKFFSVTGLLLSLILSVLASVEFFDGSFSTISLWKWMTLNNNQLRIEIGLDEISAPLLILSAYLSFVLSFFAIRSINEFNGQ